ncbi:cation:proton antiporter, partial [Methanosarcinales archaeon]
MIPSIDLALLFFIVLLAVATIVVKDLLIATMLLSAYSFLMAMVWVEMHSVDVGFTEAAVGAGASTAFLIAALSRTVRREKDVRDKARDKA